MASNDDFDRRLSSFVWASGWTFLVSIGFNCLMFIWYILEVDYGSEGFGVFAMFPVEEAAAYFLRVKLLTAIIGFIFLASYLWRRRYRLLSKSAGSR